MRLYEGIPSCAEKAIFFSCRSELIPHESGLIRRANYCFESFVPFVQPRFSRWNGDLSLCLNNMEMSCFSVAGCVKAKAIQETTPERIQRTSQAMTPTTLARQTCLFTFDEIWREGGMFPGQFRQISGAAH